MKPTFNNKTASCNKENQISVREAIILRCKLLITYFPREDEELWKELPINNNYLISSWGRIINLKSHRGKKREIVPSLKKSKYPFVTITMDGRRKGFSLRKMVQMLFERVGVI